MSRRLTDRQRAIQPLRQICAPSGWDNFDDRDHRSARTSSPYQAGDEVPTDNGKRALIIQVLAERLTVGDPFSTLLPKYRVRFRRADGMLAENWNYIWPGHIERGFTTKPKDSKT